MSRFAAVFQADLKNLLRYGFVPVAVVVTATWSIALHFVPESDSDTWIPVALWLDMAIVGFFFMTAVVLYEKSQRTMIALVVTPLRFREYLGPKIASLTLLALAACVVVTILSRGTDFRPIWLLVGVTLTSVITLLYGFATVMPFSSMSTYILPANLYLLVLQAALIPHFGWSEFFLLKLLPTYGALQLVQGAFTKTSTTDALLYLLSCAFWVAFLSIVCTRLHRKYVLVKGRD